MKLKYGQKDGITGRNKRGELIYRKERNMPQNEIDEMLLRIKNRREDFARSMELLPSITDFRSEGMIG